MDYPRLVRLLRQGDTLVRDIPEKRRAHDISTCENLRCPYPHELTPGS